MVHRSFLLLLTMTVATSAADQAAPVATTNSPAHDLSAIKAFIQTHCLACHDRGNREAGLALDELLLSDLDRHADVWENVIRKLTARQMPPRSKPQPTKREYDATVASLESSLDGSAAGSPNPGRTETFRRLNRTEYQNTIRDLVGLPVDVAALLPPDESSRGFDNITVADLSPMLLNRYISAAQRISRLAVGATKSPVADTFRIKPDVTQDSHVEGLPLGTRGGILIPYYFPLPGEYEIQIHLMRDRNDEVEGLKEPHELDVLLDRKSVERFSIRPPSRGQTNQSVDANLKARINVTAGPHHVGATFLKKASSLQESTRQPLNVHFNFYRHPRLGPAVYEVSIVGPVPTDAPARADAPIGSDDSVGLHATLANGSIDSTRAAAAQSPSRIRIFSCRPTSPEDEDACARRILSGLARKAYRRPINDDDLNAPLRFFQQGRAEAGFETGIELALSSLLVNPQFLFRIERDPPDLKAGSVYRINGVELASRLSYFLWSSMPDDELLDRAVSGELNRPEVLEQQVRRMLADDRSRSLVTNFAGQWLYLRNLDAVNPDMRLYPDFDDNLRQSLRQETELFFESVLREDRSVLDLVNADYTFLNERLAKHYGIPHVYGSRFRRVTVANDSNEDRRGGLLRQGSILTVTSYATRTSPVIRGHWVLQNLLGMEPPPPPPDVPTLDDNMVSSLLPMRERLQKHRENATCANCHQQMDPVGFSLENFDAVGRWRWMDAGQSVDATGGLDKPDEFTGAAGLERALLERPELFVRTLTEKLLTFGLGRGVEYHDAPAIRRIVRDVRNDSYRFSRLILGIVNSTPFQMRTIR